MMLRVMNDSAHASDMEKYKIIKKLVRIIIVNCEKGQNVRDQVRFSIVSLRKVLDKAAELLNTIRILKGRK